MTPTAVDPPRRSLDVRTLERLALGLERVLPWAARVIRPVAVLAGAGGFAGLILWAIVLDALGADGLVEWVLIAALLLLLLVPAAVLALFLFFLRQLFELPDHIRSLPVVTREQGVRLVGLIDELRQAREQRRRWRIGAGWRLGRELLGVGGLVEPFTSLAVFAKLPYLVLVGFAALGAVLEVFLCLTVLVGIALV
jgi:hypothetical protein